MFYVYMLWTFSVRFPYSCMGMYTFADICEWKIKCHIRKIDYVIDKFFGYIFMAGFWEKGVARKQRERERESSHTEQSRTHKNSRWAYEWVIRSADSRSTCSRQPNMKMYVVELTQSLDVWRSQGAWIISQPNQPSAYVVNFRSKQLYSMFKPKTEITRTAHHSIIKNTSQENEKTRCGIMKL